MSDGWKTIIIACLVLTALLCSWFFLLYKPKISRVQTLKDESNNVLLKLRSMRVTEVQVAALRSQVESLKTEIERTQRRVVPKDVLPDIVKSIQKKSEKHGLKFLSILPDYNSLMSKVDGVKSDVLKLTIHMKMQGDYVSLGNFIESLASSPFYISVGEMTLSYSTKIYPQLDIVIDTQVYLRNELGSSDSNI